MDGFQRDTTQLRFAQRPLQRQPWFRRTQPRPFQSSSPSFALDPQGALRWNLLYPRCILAWVGTLNANMKGYRGVGSTDPNRPRVLGNPGRDSQRPGPSRCHAGRDGARCSERSQPYARPAAPTSSLSTKLWCRNCTTGRPLRSPILCGNTSATPTERLCVNSAPLLILGCRPARDGQKRRRLDPEATLSTSVLACWCA